MKILLYYYLVAGVVSLVVVPMAMMVVKGSKVYLLHITNVVHYDDVS